MRVLAFGLALLCWVVVLSLAYEIYKYAAAPVEGWSFLLGTLLMALWSSYAAIRGSVPSWFIPSIAFFGSAKNSRTTKRR